MTKRSTISFVVLTLVMALAAGSTLAFVPFAGAGGAVTATPTATLTPPPPYELTILHTNDIHAHHAADADGNGGAALAASVIKQVRHAVPNTLLLNAGDNFTGTLFHVVHEGMDSADLLNAQQYEVTTLGNHEFDDGDGALSLFIKALKMPMVAANVDFSKSTVLKDLVKPYTIIEKGGQKIGIIGLANPDTPTMARPGKDLVFDADLAKSVQKYTDEITEKGVNKIIVLSHIGFEADKKLAAEVDKVDIIVGGHSHTLVSNIYAGAEKPYPAVVTDEKKETVLVVQAGEYEEFIGRLNVVFDQEGVLTKWGGDTIQLSGYVTPDTTVTALVAKLAAPIEKLTKEKIGESTVKLEGDRKICRFQECNLGNLITDAMRIESKVQVALENSGGIRASIDSGDVTRGSVLNVLPFGNLMSTFKLSGEDLLAVLEHGVSQVDQGAGRFLQVSGIKFTYDPKQPVGSRVVSAEVMDDKGAYQPIDTKATYSVATNDFTREGGDDFTMLRDKAIDAYDYGRPLDEVVTDYIKENSPIKIAVEGRITAK